MKRLLLAAVIAAFNFGFAHAEGPNALTAAELSSGWKPLFNGVNLDGWRGFRSATPGEGWKVTNGEITTPGQGGDLITVGEVGDFQLSLEWKVCRGSNSGIIYRVVMNEAATYETGPEYQWLDNVNSQENHCLHSAVALYDVFAPINDYPNPTPHGTETRT